jgi:hypothetical protein
VPAPTSNCGNTDPRAKCNRCIVRNCPAEVIYCYCSDCFDYSGGCLPLCGPSFAGLDECIDANCKDDCAL